MQKDVIYIDVEDDITAIIGKVKSAEHEIIALVPPKRIGVLQSAVNVRLVNRAAEQAHKKLVLITNNHALMGLAAATSIPVAKNLQSRPEVPEMTTPDTDDSETVIDGAALPIGDHAQTVEPKPTVEEAAVDNAVDSISARDKLGTAAVASSMKDPTKSVSRKTKITKSPIKVPNFNTTRKKLFLIIGGIILLIALLVWAIFFAPHARITIQARTSTSAASAQVRLGPELSTSLDANTLKTVQKEATTDVSIPITPTGEKQVGEKATGTIRLTNSSFDSATVSGTVSAGGFNFTLQSPVTVPGGGCSSTRNCADGSATGTIVATQPGANLNGVSGSVSGLPKDIAGSLTSPTSGGTDKTVPVATQSDIDIATAKIAESSNTDKIKKDLARKLGGAIVIDASFQSDNSAVKPNVTANQEFGGTTPAITGKVKYTMSAVEKSEIDKFLDAYFARVIDGHTNQRVYDNGDKNANFTNVSPADGGFRAQLSANGKIGPRIDETALKEYARGKKYGEIQSHVEAIEGVDSVDVKFSPFWVNAAPNDINRIKVEFKIND